MDPFALNIKGVEDLIDNDTNKTLTDGNDGEGVTGEFEDVLDLPMSDDECLDLRDQWEVKSNGYTPKITPRQKKNKLYYSGKQSSNSGDLDKVVPNNLIFEAEETFIPEALSKNPEPVVWSDNTEEGKTASNEVKTMLQYHADVLCLRKNLGMMMRQWSIYFIGVIKHGWDPEVKDIKLDLRKPQNFVLDPDGYIDVYGNYCGAYLGERIESSAEELIKLFPKHKDYILLKVNGKLGTLVIRTEWWTDKYSFTTFQEKILDKHKNEFFNYEGKDGLPPINHFAVPKMPYTFLSVFSLQEHPHDITNLIEQSIPNQDRINDRDEQISKNLASANNSVVLSGLAFTSETAGQARDSFYEEGFLLVPNGEVDKAVKRLPADNLPTAIFTAQDNDKLALRSVFGTQGLTAAPQNEDTTARGMILNQAHDSSRIGGGIGDALEQVADNIFNWWLQEYCVFYDEVHYAAIMGSGRAVEYSQIINTNLIRKFVVSVSPNSMQPKDEVSEQNTAVELANQGWLDPINLFKKLNYPDPMETAKMVTLFRISPQQYFATYFPEVNPQGATNSQNPQQPAPPPEQGSPPESLATPPASPSLGQVPLPAIPK